MKKEVSISILTLLLALSPCTAFAGNALDTLNGKWKVDVPGTIAILGDVPGDPLDRKMLEAFLGSISMEFNVAGKQLLTRMGGESKTESFAVESETDSVVVLRKGNVSVSYEIHSKDKVIGGTGKGKSKRLVLRRTP